MTLPTDEVMSLLLAVVTGQEIAPVDGVLTVALPTRDGSTHVITNVDAELDALEARGWVVIGDERPEATEQGCYALRLWLKRRFRIALAGFTGLAITNVSRTKGSAGVTNH